MGDEGVDYENLGLGLGFSGKCYTANRSRVWGGLR